MSISVIDPVADPRWADFVGRHTRASIFQTPQWLQALRRTYGYEPIALTTSLPDGPLDNGLVACQVGAWLSRRLVSLPFSDHCDPLMDRTEDLREMLSFLADEVERGTWRRVELRPTGGDLPLPVRSNGFAACPEYCLHRLDLSPAPEELFKRFHGSCTQRAIRRADREGLTYEVGTSPTLLASFYRLLRLTRRRHELPPQPLAWFENLVECLRDRLAIHVASKNEQPIASLLTLSFKKTMVYKYGGSEAAQHRLGGMPFLFWRVIRDAKAEGYDELDLGRSDPDQPGLIAFKDHLGATRSTLTYYRCPEGRADIAHDGPLSRAARRAVARMPDVVLDLAGKLLYRHLG